MSNAEAVKKWRKENKKRMIASMGGHCCVCEYNKCDEALEFHHLNPKEKDFSLGQIRANAKSWDKIVKELRKCVLICANCHREVHKELIKIPDNHIKFNEEYVDYKEKRKEESMTPCIVCGQLKNRFLKTCSYRCSAKLKCRANYPDINVLVEQVKELGYVGTGKLYNVSDNAIRKRIKKYT